MKIEIIYIVKTLKKVCMVVFYKIIRNFEEFDQYNNFLFKQIYSICKVLQFKLGNTVIELYYF